MWRNPEDSMKGRGIWVKEVRVLQRNHDSTKEETTRGIINEKEMTSDNDQLARRVEGIMEVNVGIKVRQFVTDVVNQGTTRTLVQMLQRELMQSPESMLKETGIKEIAINSKGEPMLLSQETRGTTRKSSQVEFLFMEFLLTHYSIQARLTHLFLLNMLPRLVEVPNA